MDIDKVMEGVLVSKPKTPSKKKKKKAKSVNGMRYYEQLLNENIKKTFNE